MKLSNKLTIQEYKIELEFEQNKIFVYDLDDDNIAIETSKGEVTKVNTDLAKKIEEYFGIEVEHLYIQVG